jgi:hypothetical protein
MLRAEFAYDVRHVARVHHANVARNKGCYFWTAIYLRASGRSAARDLNGKDYLYIQPSYRLQQTCIRKIAFRHVSFKARFAIS